MNEHPAIRAGIAGSFFAAIAIFALPAAAQDEPKSQQDQKYYSLKKRMAQSEGGEKEAAAVERSCGELVEEVSGTLGSRAEERKARVDELRQEAQGQPLVLAMKDGGFIFLGDESAELAEPFESWFSSEAAEKELAEAITLAQNFLDEGDEEKCIEALNAFSGK